MDFLHLAMWHDHDIDFARWLHCSHLAKSTAPCNVAGGSGMICHWIRPNVRHIVILHLVSISTNHCSRHVILHQFPKFYPNRNTLGRKKITSCWFSRWRISDILDFRDPITGSLKSPYATSYSSSIDTVALNCFAFFLHFGDRQTEKQTNRWTALMH